MAEEVFGCIFRAYPVGRGTNRLKMAVFTLIRKLLKGEKKSLGQPLWGGKDICLAAPAQQVHVKSGLAGGAGVTMQRGAELLPGNR